MLLVKHKLRKMPSRLNYSVTPTSGRLPKSAFRVSKSNRKSRNKRRHKIEFEIDPTGTGVGMSKAKSPYAILKKRVFTNTPRPAGLEEFDAKYYIPQQKQYLAQRLKNNIRKTNKKVAVSTIARKSTTRLKTKGSPSMMRGRPKGSKNKKNIHNAAQTPAVTINKKLADTLTSRGSETGIINSHNLDGRPVMPVSVNTSKRSFKAANNMERRVIHKTDYQTGFNPSKALREAARTNGTGASVLYDSKMIWRTNSDRDILTNGAGFNSTNIHLPAQRAQFDRRTVDELLSLGYPTPGNLEITNAQQRETVIASVMKLKRQFMIHNNSAFLPMHLKICLARYKKRSTLTCAQAFAFCGLNETEFSTIATQLATTPQPTFLSQPNGKMPYVYQHSPITVTGTTTYAPYGGGTVVNVDVSNKSRGLWESTIFKENFELVETFEKLIPAGDFWNFSHTHNCGGGIDVGQFAEENGTTDEGSEVTIDDPYSFVIWFETRGTLCEGLRGNSQGGVENYLGTSPTYYTYEFKTSAYFVKDNDTNQNQSSNSALTSNKVHRREYSSDPLRTGAIFQNFRKEIFVLPASITNDPIPGDGEMIIPVLSGKIVTTNQPQGGFARKKNKKKKNNYYKLM